MISLMSFIFQLQELLLNECTIIYECKICRNLFRSLANFISHKRIYCIKNFSYFTEETTRQEVCIPFFLKVNKVVYCATYLIIPCISRHFVSIVIDTIKLDSGYICILKKFCFLSFCK